MIADKTYYTRSPQNWSTNSNRVTLHISWYPITYHFIPIYAAEIGDFFGRTFLWPNERLFLGDLSQSAEQKKSFILTNSLSMSLYLQEKVNKLSLSGIRPLLNSGVSFLPTLGSATDPRFLIHTIGETLTTWLLSGKWCLITIPSSVSSQWEPHNRSPCFF